MLCQAKTVKFVNKPHFVWTFTALICFHIYFLSSLHSISFYLFSLFSSILYIFFFPYIPLFFLLLSGRTVFCIVYLSILFPPSPFFLSFLLLIFLPLFLSFSLFFSFSFFLSHSSCTALSIVYLSTLFPPSSVFLSFTFRLQGAQHW